MNTNRNRFDYLLELFVSDDKLRPKMMRPYAKNGYVYATDAHAIIRIPAEKPALNYSQEYEFYDVEKYFAESNQANEIYVDFKQIENFIDSTPIINLFDNCDFCDGDGEVYCSCCENSSRCKTCDGTGMGQKIGVEPDYNHKLMVDGVGFNYKNLYRLFLSKSVQDHDAKWVLKSQTSRNMFVIGDIEVVLMPRL